MPKVFISYRRADSSHITERIRDSLEPIVGADSLFLDIDSIPSGMPFRDVVSSWLARADVVLVVIGRDWVSCIGDDGSRRLDDPTDLVRVEVEGALAAGCLVVPVTVDGAHMPKAKDLPGSIAALAGLNACEVRGGKDFHRDIALLTSGWGRSRDYPHGATDSGISGDIRESRESVRSKRKVDLNSEEIYESPQAFVRAVPALQTSELKIRGSFIFLGYCVLLCSAGIFGKTYLSHLQSGIRISILVIIGAIILVLISSLVLMVIGMFKVIRRPHLNPISNVSEHLAKLKRHWFNRLPFSEQSRLDEWRLAYIAKRDRPMESFLEMADLENACNHQFGIAPNKFADVIEILQWCD